MVGLLQILSVVAPWLDLMIGTSRSEVQDFVKLRTTCITATDIIMIIFRVDGHGDISFHFALNCKDRHRPKMYPLKKQPKMWVSPGTHDYDLVLKFARREFTYVTGVKELQSSLVHGFSVDRTGQAAPRANPVPKSKFRPAIQKLTLTVYNNIIVYEVEVLNSATVERVKTMIQSKSNISADRMTLYFESSSGLVELDDIKLLSDYSITNGCSLVLFTRKAEWEDSSVDERATQKMVEDLDKKDDTPWGRIRQLLDQMDNDEDRKKLVELRRNYENARMTYRKSRDAAVKALEAFREFDQLCSEKYGHAWSQNIFGNSSSSSGR